MSSQGHPQQKYAREWYLVANGLWVQKPRHRERRDTNVKMTNVTFRQALTSVGEQLKSILL